MICGYCKKEIQEEVRVTFTDDNELKRYHIDCAVKLKTEEV